MWLVGNCSCVAGSFAAVFSAMRSILPHYLCEHASHGDEGNAVDVLRDNDSVPSTRTTHSEFDRPLGTPLLLWLAPVALVALGNFP